MNIEYKNVQEFIGWDKAEAIIQKLILENNFKSILELGAGANPTIQLDFIKTNKLNYTISDIDPVELAKAGDIYSKEVLNLNTKEMPHSKKYDFIFSRMVSEHISNGYYFYRNIYSILNEGGITFHCFSTLYSFPFLINRLFPETLSDFLLKIISPREDIHKHGKFKAYYSWCRGPSNKMIRRYLKIGYEILNYTGYYGHNYYKKIPILNGLEVVKTQLLLKTKNPYLTSYAHIVLKK